MRLRLKIFQKTGQSFPKTCDYNFHISPANCSPMSGVLKLSPTTPFAGKLRFILEP